MRISAVTQAYSTEIRKVDSAKRDSTPPKGKPQAADSSSLSNASKVLNATQHTTDVVGAAIALQPEIRQEKVAEVQEKLRNHYYDSMEFVDSLAEKLMKDFGLGSGSI